MPRILLERELVEPLQHRALVVPAERDHRRDVRIVGLETLVQREPGFVIGARRRDERRPAWPGGGDRRTTG